MPNKIDLRLYAVTDRSWLNGRAIEDIVRQAVEGGATCVQLREKDLSTRDFIHSAEKVKCITEHYGVPLIINDRLDVALAVDAEGLHVGQDDMPVNVARRLLGTEKILGVSVGNLMEAVKAEQDGADYIGAGAVFPTTTKADAYDVNPDQLRSIAAGISIPTVAIGGINENNVMKLQQTGIAGIAVVSAIFAKADPKSAAAALRNLTRNIFSEVR